VKSKKEELFEEPVEIDLGEQEVPGQADLNGETPTAEADDELSEVKAALESAENELSTHRDAMLRMQAETVNLRNRLNRELEKSRKFALERIMKDLLQVRDSMDRGLEVDPGSATVDSLLEGQSLTQKMLAKVMQDHGLELIDPQGEVFDPEFHEAVTMLPSPDLPDGSVMEVLQKGYKLHDRLVRPAMVVVSTTP
jgi:molecular chaperone GrpE